MVIVSPAAFNQQIGTPVVLPITQGGYFARQRGFAVSLDPAGLHTKGVTRCDQPRAIDMNARRGQYVETVPDFIMADVLARLATFLQ